MFRDILSSRAIQVGIAFFMMVVGGSLLYSWHVRHNSAAEMERTDQSLQKLRNKKETRTTQDTTVPTDTETLKSAETPMETDNTQMRTEETDVLPKEALDPINLADAFLPEDFVSDEEAFDDVPVSPFGFGPYPEVPEDFPENLLPSWTWSEDKRQRYADAGRLMNFELMHRVLIKLWNQGDRDFIGVKRSEQNGKVYPIYQNVMYVWTWVERQNGAVRLPASFFGSSQENIHVLDIMKQERVPNGITFLDADVEGYDPYEFLNLQ